MSDLSAMFDPKRVAVIVATDREGSIGRAVMENPSTFDGDVIPVNPSRETVLGMRCDPEIGDIPDATSVGLAVVRSSALEKATPQAGQRAPADRLQSTRSSFPVPSAASE